MPPSALPVTPERRLERAASYDRVASVYDALSAFYSWGAIARSKEQHIRFLERDQTVLYAGAGTGAECVQAARTGAKVTVREASARMLARCRQRFETEDLKGHFEHADALSGRESFDVVVAPYFLNVFSSDEVGQALASLASQIKQGGRLVTIDFRAPAESALLRGLQRLHYLPPRLLFLALSNNPWHELYDYVKLANSSAPQLSLSTRIPTRVLGVPLYETIIWDRIR